MASKLTKTRLALLQAVADGKVHDWYEAGEGWRTVLYAPPARPRNVFARMREAQDAGWVSIGFEYRGKPDRTWSLTAAGKEALASVPPEGQP